MPPERRASYASAEVVVRQEVASKYVLGKRKRSVVGQLRVRKRPEAEKKTHDVSRTVVSYAERNEDRVVQEAVVQAESVPL